LVGKSEVVEPLDLPTLGGLLGLLAHDLRNPLSALQSNLGFLASTDYVIDADGREAIDDGLVSCDGLAHIIANIDLIGQLLRGGVGGEGGTIDFRVLVEEIIASCGPVAKSHNVTVHFRSDASAACLARGDRDLVVRAITNLLRNSIQHSASGTAIRVSVRLEPTEVVVRIEDQGTVLGPEERSRAFTATGQVSSKLVPTGRYSRGLGLFAARIAAEATRASVRAVESPTGGNAFEFAASRP
jgi:signal transduction histidine kinase